MFAYTTLKRNIFCTLLALPKGWPGETLHVKKKPQFLAEFFVFVYNHNYTTEMFQMMCHYFVKKCVSVQGVSTS